MAYPAITHPPGFLFDSIAEDYDAIFTDSLIGRAQRDVVWNVLRRTFGAGERVLELNCGTGEDALFLSRMGVSVHACDASARMIEVAARRIAKAAPDVAVHVELRPTEQIGTLRAYRAFDGVLSNFSGLNCVPDLSRVAQQLASLVRSRGQLVLCFSSRYCLWETAWYMAHGQLRRATRRWRGHTSAALGVGAMEVWYPTMTEIVRTFRPWFTFRRCQAVGLTVPPSYVEHLAQSHPRLLQGLQLLDRMLSTCRGLRVLGDHILLVLERTA
jgi:SAM-dependent methyltransferase